MAEYRGTSQHEIFDTNVLWKFCIKTLFIILHATLLISVTVLWIPIKKKKFLDCDIKGMKDTIVNGIRNETK